MLLKRRGARPRRDPFATDRLSAGTYGRGMSSETGGGFPGGFPSMPGFGDGASAERDVPDRLQELTERHRAGVLSDAEFELEKDRLLAEG